MLNEGEIRDLVSLGKVRSLSHTEQEALLKYLLKVERFADIEKEAVQHLGLVREVAFLDNPIGTRARFVLSLLLRTTHQREESRTVAEVAFARFAELREEAMMGRCLLLLGALNADLGNPVSALTFYAQSREFFVAPEMQTKVAASHYNESLVYLHIGDPVSAMRALTTAKSLYEELLDEANAAVCELWMGSVFRSLGQNADAIAMYHNAYSSLVKHGNRRRAAACLLNAGNVQLDSGRFREAKKLYLRSKEIYDDLGDTNRSVGCLLNLGLIAFFQGDFSIANQRFSQASGLFDQQADKRHLCEALLWQSETTLRISSVRDALHLAERAYSISLETAELPMQARSQSMIGKCALSENSLEVALDCFESSLSILEKMGSSILDPELAARANQWSSDIAGLAAKAAIALNDKHRAFKCIQRAKALHHRSHYACDDFEPNSAIGQLKLQLDQLLKPRSAESQHASVVARSGEVQELLDKIRREETANRILNDNVALISRFGREVSHPPSKVAILEFATESSSISSLLLQPKGESSAITQNLQQGFLDGLVSSLLELLNNANSSLTELDAIRNRLKEVLISSVGNVSSDTELLVVCPHGPLHRIPFGYVFEDEPYSVVVSTSASAWEEQCELAIVNKTALLIACSFDESRESEVSRLPNAINEVSIIRNLIEMEKTILINDAATPGSVLSKMRHASMIHVASHAIVNPVIPSMSHFVLFGDDEFSQRLYLRDILRADLNANLVVLSACSSAIGELSASEGPLGLAWGFLRAGSRNVVASHYPVHDLAAMKWMEHFYQAIKGGNRLASSAKIASARLREDCEFSHPHYRACWEMFGVGS